MSRNSDDVLHDVRNLLTTIAALTVRARGALDSEESASAVEAKRVITQLGVVVGNAMNLARSSGRPPATSDDVHFADYVLEHAAALGAIVGGAEHFRLHVAERASETNVRMDATDLLRVLVNVLRNAEEASDSDANVEMELDVLESTEPVEARPSALPPNRYAVVRVSDRGEGIDDGLLDVLIQPGVSSKQTGRGRGLSVVAQLLQEAAGGMRIQAREGGGSTIELFVPAGA